MGYDLLAAIFFVFLTPFVVLGFIVFWILNARDHEELAQAWRTYARRRGLEFVEPEGEWPNRTSPAILWSEGGANVRLTAIGREARVRTRLVVRPRSALLGMAVLSLDESGARVHEREHPAGFAKRISNATVVRSLHALHQRDRITLAYRRGRVTLEWPGGEQSDSRLDDARSIAAEVVATIEAEFRAPAAAADNCPPAVRGQG